MKVLWLCNLAIGESDASGTGTWLGAMAHGLMDAGGIELGIVSEAAVSQVTRRDFRDVSQWLVPECRALGRNGLPTPSVFRGIGGVCDAFAAELIHVWGTEGYWGLLTARGLVWPPSLPEIQQLWHPRVGAERLLGLCQGLLGLAPLPGYSEGPCRRTTAK